MCGAERIEMVVNKKKKDILDGKFILCSLENTALPQFLVAQKKEYSFAQKFETFKELSNFLEKKIEFQRTTTFKL